MRKSVYLVGVGFLLLAGAALAWFSLAGARTFEGKGRVVGFGGEATVYVEHSKIARYLPARTTPFRAGSPAQLDSLEMGDAIRFEIVATRNSVKIKDVEKLPDNALPRNPAAKEAPPRAGSNNSKTLQAGEPVPDVTLIDQDGKRVHLSDYRGQALVLTFIYTNCPLPNFCPLMSEQFAALQPRLKKAFGEKAQLLSISFDPKNDTPQVLTDYASKYTDDLSTWTFATPATLAQLEKAKEAFGITTIQKKGEIVHNLVTALIGLDGRLVWQWRGNDWTPEDIFEVVKQTLTSNKQTAAPTK